MTIRVEEETFAVKCNECKSKLYFTWEDVVNNRSLSDYYFECPQCFSDVRVAKCSSISQALRHIRECYGQEPEED